MDNLSMLKYDMDKNGDKHKTNIEIKEAIEPLNIIWENMPHYKKWYVYTKFLANIVIVICLAMYFKYMLNVKRKAYHIEQEYPINSECGEVYYHYNSTL